MKNLVERLRLEQQTAAISKEKSLRTAADMYLQRWGDRLIKSISERCFKAAGECSVTLEVLLDAEVVMVLQEPWAFPDLDTELVVIDKLLTALLIHFRGEGLRAAAFPSSKKLLLSWEPEELTDKHDALLT